MRWPDRGLGTATLGVITVVFGLAGPVGCKGDKGGKASAKAVADEQKVSQEEDDLMRQRDDLFSTRKKLQERRAELDAEHRRIIAAGGDDTEVVKKKEELDKEEAGLSQSETDLNNKLDSILAQRRAITQALAAGNSDDKAKVAAREAGVSEREKALASREARVAKREAELAARERDVLRFKNEKCAGARQPTTIIQTVDAKGSKYTKKDVEPLLKRARRDMARKGILASDLPPAAQSLENEATKAMAKGDYGKARFAATQLLATVRSTRINKSFVQDKIGRLSAAMKGRNLSASAQKEVDSLFRQATAEYGDGKFTSANRRLNKIYAKI